TARASVARTTMLLLVAALCLHGAYARGAARQSPEPTKPQAVKADDKVAKSKVALSVKVNKPNIKTDGDNKSGKPSAPDASFRSVTDLTDLGNPQPISLQGTQSRSSVRFALSTSQVVTSATLDVHYRLAPELAE